MARRLLTIETGLACNNHCGFCPQRVIRGFGGHQVELSTDELKRRLDRAREECYDEVGFSGGEPTIRRDLVEIVAYARSVGFRKAFITTNGRMLAYSDLAERLVEAGLTGVTVSLHGPDAEVHDGLTGVKGAFSQAVKGLANLQGAAARLGRRLDLSTVTLVVPRNLPYLRDILVLAGRLGATLHIVQPFILSRENLDRADEFLLPVESIVKGLEGALEGGMPHKGRVKPFNIPQCLVDHLGDVIEPQTYSLKTFREFEDEVDSGAGRRPKGQFYRTGECDECGWTCPGFRIEHMPESDAVDMILEAVSTTLAMGRGSDVTLGSLDMLTRDGLEAVLGGTRELGTGRVRVVWGGYGRTDTGGLLGVCRKTGVDEVCLLAYPEMVRPPDRRAHMPGNLVRIRDDLALFREDTRPRPSLLAVINMLYHEWFDLDEASFLGLVSGVKESGGADAFLVAPEVLTTLMPMHDEGFRRKVVSAARGLEASIREIGVRPALVSSIERPDRLPPIWLETRLGEVFETVDWSTSYVGHPFVGRGFGWVMWSHPGWLFHNDSLEYSTQRSET